ncbi:hypothetical protein T439DRAFT_106938 [Meredithblackwellia eburnea MCA 4105]
MPGPGTFGNRSRRGSVSSRRSIYDYDDTPTQAPLPYGDDFVTAGSGLDDPATSSDEDDYSRPPLRKTPSRLFSSVPPNRTAPFRPPAPPRSASLPRRLDGGFVSGAAAGASGNLGGNGNFDLLQRFKLESADITVELWRSRVTGLKLLHANPDGAIIDGHFQVNTEIFNDSGCPHTLEHLLFCGSKKFPYNGVLDKVGNRCIGNGTNAWTQSTNTTFTCSLASEEGFLTLLPVYLDHLFFPTLTEAAFTTEVYNIDGKGQDGGVVLSEMQGTATGCGDLMALATMRTLYNKDNGNRSETGGLIPNLRKLHIEDIREYHDSMYVPQDMTLMIIGNATTPEALLDVLNHEVEPSLIAAGFNKGPRPPGWRRPFVESKTASNPPVIPHDMTKEVPYPSKDESTGSISLNWVGPSWHDFLEGSAITCLNSYLTDSDVSPMQKAFTQGKDPWCSGVSFSMSGEPRILSCDADSVPKDKLDVLPGKIRDLLLEISRRGIDMERMQNEIKTLRQCMLESIEKSPSGYLYSTLNENFLYGDAEGGELQAAFDDIGYCRTLATWDQEKWIDLLERTYIHPFCLTVIGRPSAALIVANADKSAAYVASNVARFGASGLAKLAKKKEDAVKENAKGVPDSLLRKFRIPDLAGIHWKEPVTAKGLGVARTSKSGPPANAVQKKIDDEGVRLPLHTTFEHLKSNFITITICMFFSDLPGLLEKRIKTLIPLFVDTFGSLPVKRANGEFLRYEDVIKQVNIDSISCSMAVSGEKFLFSMNVVKENYGVALAWMKDLLWGSVFDVTRLRNALTQAAQSLPDEKQSGASVVGEKFSYLVNNDRCNSHALNVLSRNVNTPALLKRLNKEPETVIEELEALRRGFTNPRTMRVLVTGDILAMDAPAGAWIKYFEPITPFSPRDLLPIPLAIDQLSPLGVRPRSLVQVTKIPSIESCFAIFGCAGPHPWNDPDIPALTVANGVLNVMEGILWNAVRGKGLAYGASISHESGTGLTKLDLFRCPDAYAAWAACRDVIHDVISGKIQITKLDLEAAKSTYAYNTAEAKATAAITASDSFVTQVLHGRPADCAKIQLAGVRDVTLPQVIDSISRYIVPLFDPNTSIGAITCGPSKWNEMEQKFTSERYKVMKDSFE